MKPVFVAIFFTVLAAFATPVFAQTFTISGKITDSATNKPVIAASVFLSNTSFGTSTSESGAFTLHAIPKGRFNLVVSSLGYATYALVIVVETMQQPLTIVLSPQANELTSVVVGGYDKEGWDKYGKQFTDNFIGTSFFASSCTIKNPGVIKFNFSKKNNIIQAYSSEPIIIENKALGYEVDYKLEKFLFDVGRQSVSYWGYPLFKELPGNERKKQKWAKTRKDSYYGSMLHFMRSLYENKLTENGYEISKPKLVTNTAKLRVQALYNNLISAGKNQQDFEKKLNDDTLAYYRTVLAQTDEIMSTDKNVITTDDIAGGWGSGTVILYFNDYLTITYKNKKPPTDYLRQVADIADISSSAFITSRARLLQGKPINVLYNGVYYQPQDMYLFGYWGWSQKIALLLPFDYWPPPGD